MKGLRKMKKSTTILCALIAAACGGTDPGPGPEECVDAIDPALTYEVVTTPAEGDCSLNPSGARYRITGAELRAFSIETSSCAFDLQVTSGRGWLELDSRGVARGRLLEASLHRTCYVDATITPVQ